MADSDKPAGKPASTEGQTPPLQDEETKKATLKESLAGLNTATGREKARLEGTDEQFQEPESTEKKEIAGGDSIVADYTGNEKQEPVGLQAEPAQFAKNGTVNPNLVPSNAGPVPGATVGLTGEALRDRQQQLIDRQKELVEARQKGPEALTDEQIESMNAAELRAVAQDRGYNVPALGNTGARRAFRRAQEEDERLTAAATGQKESEEG